MPEVLKEVKWKMEQGNTVHQTWRQKDRFVGRVFGKCTLARKISKKGKSKSFLEKHNSNSL